MLRFKNGWCKGKAARIREELGRIDLDVRAGVRSQMHTLSHSILSGKNSEAAGRFKASTFDHIVFTPYGATRSLSSPQKEKCEPNHCCAKNSNHDLTPCP